MAKFPAMLGLTNVYTKPFLAGVLLSAMDSSTLDRRTFLFGGSCCLLQPHLVAAQSFNRIGCFASSLPRNLGGAAGVTSADTRILRDAAETVLRVLNRPFSVEFKYIPRAGSLLVGPNCISRHRTYRIIADPSMVSVLNRSGSGVLLTVVAHEIMHCLQFESSRSLVQERCMDRPIDVRFYELLADFGAGYVGQRLGVETQSSGSNLVLNMVSELADYEFTDTSHHGTVSERTNAWSMGRNAQFRRFPLDMAKLMRKRRVFYDVLGGPRARDVRTAQDHSDYIEWALERLYR